MKKSHSYLLIALFAGVLIALGIFRYVNKPVEDFGSKSPETTFSFSEMMHKVSNDTASLSSLKDRLVGITGQVKKVTTADSNLTVELGDTSSMSSILCQVDKRYGGAFADLKPGDSLGIQGILTGFTIDTELGFGNTVEMNYCSRLKK